MSHVKFLVVGGGASGLSFANFLREDLREDLVILEQDKELGGYCKTIKQDGFVWDYSGHFFHFKHPEIEAYLVERMEEQSIRHVEKVSWVHYNDRYIDFPFQKNIHQLPREDFLTCLYDLYFRPEKESQPKSFQDMLYQKLGRGITDKFLRPYNEKLYATSLERLDPNAMGRFFPHVDLDDVISNFKVAKNQSYNATFTYPEGGAIQYIHALRKDLPKDAICLDEGAKQIDLKKKEVTTTKGRHLTYDYLVSSAPFPKLLQMAGLPYEASTYTANKVLVFNLGFDKKGLDKPHWIYFGDKDLVFYRVGFYDNIFNTARMSLYVEIGASNDEVLSEEVIQEKKSQVLKDLEKVGIVDGHQLLSEHHVVLDPAYVHITEASQADVFRQKELLSLGQVFSIGRYGSWTYCSIEDNMLEARALARRFNQFTEA